LEPEEAGCLIYRSFVFLSIHVHDLLVFETAQVDGIMCSRWWNGKDLEGSIRGFIGVLSRSSRRGTEGSQEKSPSFSMSWLRIGLVSDEYRPQCYLQTTQFV